MVDKSLMKLILQSLDFSFDDLLLLFISTLTSNKKILSFRFQSLPMLCKCSVHKMNVGVPQISYFQLSLRFNKIKHASLEICTRKIFLKLCTDYCYFNDYLFTNFECYQYQSPIAHYISVENTVLFIL